MSATLRRGLLLGVRVGLLFIVVGLALDSPAQMPPNVLQTYKGHADPVYAVGFSPDSKYVVTGSFDKSIKIWDAGSGKELRSFTGTGGHQGLLLALAVSPDGLQIASGAADNSARTWDFPGETPQRVIDLPAEGLGLALSADGTKSAVALKDGTVKVFNQADGKELYVLKGHEGSVTQVAMTPNNQTIVTTGSDRTIRFWNLANGQPLATYGAHNGPITGLTTRADSNAAYTAGEDGSVKAWTLPAVASRGLAAPHGGPVTALTLSPDGTQVFTASGDKTIRQSTFANGAQVRAFGPVSGTLRSVAVKADLGLVAGGADDGRVQLWTGADAKDAGKLLAHTGAVHGLAFNGANQLLTVGGDGFLRTWGLPLVPGRTLAHPDAVSVSIASADGKRVFAAANDKTIYGWNLAAAQAPERKFSGHPTPITALALRADGQLLVSAGEDGALRFWNATNSQAGEILLGHTGAVTGLGFTADNQKVLSSGVDGSVRLWQIPTVNPVKPLAHPDAVLAAVVSGDGNTLVTGSADKQVRVWNLQNFQPKAFAGLTQPARTVALSPNNALVAGGSDEKGVIVWNVGDGKELAKFVNAPAGVQSLAFHADNKTLAAGLADGQVIVYDTAAKKDVKTLKAHAGPVAALTFLPSGDLLSGGADKTVQVWNLADGASKAKLDNPAPVVGLSLSKDGAKVAVVGQDKGVKLWTLADKKEVASFASPADVKGIGLSPDGTRIVLAGADNQVRLYGADGKLVERFAHDGPVAVAGFLPDGKRVYSAGADKSARINASSLLWQGNHAGPVRQAVLNTKGDRIASVGDDKQAIVWNVADGKQIKALPGEGPVTHVALNAEGVRLALCSDKSVQVFDLSKDGAVEKFTVPAAVTGLALNGTGTRLAASFTEGATHPIHVWDVTPGKERQTTPLQVLTDCTGAVRGLSFLADNRTLLTAEADKNARLIDVPALGQIKTHEGAATALSLHTNGTQVVTSGADKTVKHWDLATGKTVRILGPLAGAVTTASFSRDSAQIAAASGKQVRTWNTADGKDLATLEHPADVKSLNYNADKTRLATSGSDGRVRVWDLTTNRELVNFGHADGAVEAVTFHPNGLNVVAGGTDKTATIHTITVARMIPVGSPVRSLAVTPNGASLLTTADDKSVKQWNSASGALERPLGGGEAIGRAVAVSKNGATVGVASADKQLRLYTFADAKLVGVISLAAEPTTLTLHPTVPLATVATKDGGLTTYGITFTAGQPLPPDFGMKQLGYRHTAEVTDATYSADGNSILSTSLDKKLDTWKVPAPGAVRNFAHPQLVDAVAFAPDGKLLATGCHDGKLRTYDLAKNAVAKEINAHPAPAAPPNQQPFPIYCVTWTPDGKQILGGAKDNSAKLWDAASGNLVREFKAWKEKDFEQGHRDGVFCIAITPDVKLVATGSSDKTIKLWNPADGSVVRTLTNPNLKPTGPMAPPPSHPGSVYGVRFLDKGQKLLSVGGAPRGMGYIALWNVADGKLLSFEEVPIGTIFSLAVSGDETKMLVGTGSSVRTAGTEANNAYLMKVPGK